MLMLKSWSLIGGSALAMALAVPTNDRAPDAPDALGMRVGKVTLQSASQMTFGPSNVLFLADPRAGQLYALDLPDTRKASLTGTYMLLTDLDEKVAGLLGTTRDKVRFGDMATHPVSGALYFTVTRAGANGSFATLVRVGSKDQIELVNLDQVRHSGTAVPASPPADTTVMYGQPKWAATVTDLNMVDGELWVAGLSNEQFASALRRVPFPFGKSGGLATVEIYHTAHNKWETAAPIEAFMPLTLNGVPTVLAGYGCSPLALFSVADLKAGGHRKGKTVAELGGGSRPIDFVRYQREGKEFILIANSNRTLMRMDPAELAAAREMTTPVERAFVSGGVPYLSVASAGVMQLADLDAERIVVLARDTESGAVNLQAYGKKWL
jgi:hypothetical protein